MKKNLQNYDESRNNMYSGFRNGSRHAHILEQGNLRGTIHCNNATNQLLHDYFWVHVEINSPF